MDVIRRFVSLRSKLSMLNRATADNDEPTAGYMYDEIARMTYESEDICVDLREYLLSRLRKDSPRIKAKALRILCQCVIKGHTSFRKAMKLKTDEIRAVSNYRGTPHPLHGDSLNQAVRAAATELMTAIFDDDMREDITQRRHMEGFGNTAPNSYTSESRSSPPTSTFSSISNSGNSRIVGFGNTAAPAPKQSITQRIRNTISRDRGPTTGGGSASYAPPLPMSSASSARVEPKPQSAATFSSRELQGPLAVDSGYEQRLVEDIASPGGIKAAPPRDQLDRFIQRCHSLDGHKIADALQDVLNEPESDRQLLRTLYVVKALQDSSITGIQSCLSILKPTLNDLLSHNNGSTRDKAAQILRNFKYSGEQDATSNADQDTSSNASATSAAQTQNLLDMENDVGGEDNAESGSNMSGMFSGMTLQTGGSSDYQAEAEVSLVATAEPSSSSSLFSGMTMSGQHESSSGHELQHLESNGGLDSLPQAEQVSSGNSGLLDDFLSPSPSQSSQSAPAADTDLLSTGDDFDPLAALGATSSSSASASQGALLSEPGSHGSLLGSLGTNAHAASQPAYPGPAGGTSLGLSPMPMNQSAGMPVSQPMMPFMGSYGGTSGMMGVPGAGMMPAQPVAGGTVGLAPQPGFGSIPAGSGTSTSTSTSTSTGSAVSSRKTAQTTKRSDAFDFVSEHMSHARSQPS